MFTFPQGNLRQEKDNNQGHKHEDRTDEIDVIHRVAQSILDSFQKLVETW
jgi:hypothetical protein